MCQRVISRQGRGVGIVFKELVLMQVPLLVRLESFYGLLG